MKIIVKGACCLIVFLALSKVNAAVSTRLYEYTDIKFTNVTVSGNPYDSLGYAVFSHQGSSEKRVTELFYLGSGNTWVARFTPTQTGTWTMVTHSSDSDLNNQNETITVTDNPGDPGFIGIYQDKFIWTGTDKAFTPGLAMVSANGGSELDNFNEAITDSLITAFGTEHGFNGLHILVMHQWVSIGNLNGQGSKTDPDPLTFEKLEMILGKTHAAGLMVHFWAWGDHARDQTCRSFSGGTNGVVDRRIQRYIAARLGPIPGWTIGYGFDLDEWCNASDLATWHSYMHAHLGWPHIIGGRSDGPNRGTNYNSYTWTGHLDYAGYEHHLGGNSPTETYNVFVAGFNAVPGKPVFSEDRNRVRDQGRSKDVTEEETRRILWISSMAAGVAGIYGYLLPDNSISKPYPHKEYIRTWGTFWEGRFLKDMVRAGSLTDGWCLRVPGKPLYIFYKENTNSIQYDISDAGQAQKVIAVDAGKAYQEIDLGSKAPGNHTYTAASQSDWALAVGDFSGTSMIGQVDNQAKETIIPCLFPQPLTKGQELHIRLPDSKMEMVHIYNSRGKMVRELTDAGDQSIIWDGKDSQNQTVKRGICILRAGTDKGIISSKIIIVQ